MVVCIMLRNRALQITGFVERYLLLSPNRTQLYQLRGPVLSHRIRR